MIAPAPDAPPPGPAAPPADTAAPNTAFVPIGFGDLSSFDHHESRPGGRHANVGVPVEITTALQAILEPFLDRDSLPRDLEKVRESVAAGDLHAAAAPLERAWKAWIRAHQRRQRAVAVRVTRGFNVLHAHCRADPPT